MAIDKVKQNQPADNPQANPQPQPQPQPQAQPQFQAPPHFQVPPQFQQPLPRLSWTDQERLSLFQIGRSKQPTNVLELSKAFKEFAKEKNYGNVTLDTTILDNSNYPDLHYSVLVFSARYDEMDIKPVIYYSYILIGTGEKIPTKTININNKPVEVVRLPADAWDDVLRQVTVEALARKYPGSEILESGASTIDADYQLTDQYRENQWHLFINALLACRRSMDHFFNPNDLELANFDNNVILTTTIERSTGEEVTDRVGMPSRTDVVITNTSRSRNNDNSGSVNRRGSAVISRIGGYFDLMWTRPTQQYGQWTAPGQPQPVQPPSYTPIFVITQATPEYRQSLPNQLFMLASAATISESTNWTFSFMPKRTMQDKDDFSLRDISALGFDIPVNPDGTGQRITGMENGVSEGDLNMLFARVATPVPAIALDVMECGASTWEHGVFAACAKGDPSAIADVNFAMNKLTNGIFSKYWNGTSPICYSYGGRIPAGYYIGVGNKRKDIRNIDYLAMLNLFGDRDMNVVRQYSEAWNNDSLAPEIRTKWRKAVTDEMGAIYTGWYRRVVFTAAFLQALTASLRESGVGFVMEAPNTEVTANIRTPVSFLQYVVTPTPVSSGLFTQGYQQQFYNQGMNTQQFNGYVDGRYPHYSWAGPYNNI